MVRHFHVRHFQRPHPAAEAGRSYSDTEYADGWQRKTAQQEIVN